MANHGTIEPTAGTLVLLGSITNAGDGILAAAGGERLSLPAGLSNSGVISLTGGTLDAGIGTIANTGQITGYGVIRSGGLNNNGTMTLTGGTSTVNGPVTNSVGKTINVKYQPAIFTGNVTNNGTFKITGTTVTFAGNYTGNAYISDPSDNIFQADVTVTAGGSMSGASGDRFFMSGGNFINHGTFNNGGLLQSFDAVASDGAFTQTGTLTEAGNFTNSGTATIGGIQNWTSGAMFTNTAGTATFQSDAGSTANSPLKVQINGGLVTFVVQQHLAALSIASPSGAVAFDLASPTSFGKAVVNGILTVGGTLQVSLTNNFIPLPGNSFDLLDWGSLSGTFNALNLPTMNGHIVWDSSQLYTTGVLSVTATYLAGDFNRDGHVDAADILPMQQALTNLSNFKSAHSALSDAQLLDIEDVNGDGKVTNADLQDLLDTLKSGGGSTDPVPEPASLAMLGVGALAIGFHWCSRKTVLN